MRTCPSLCRMLEEAGQRVHLLTWSPTSMGYHFLLEREDRAASLEGLVSHWHLQSSSPGKSL